MNFVTDSPSSRPRPFAHAFRDYLHPPVESSPAKRVVGYSILFTLFALGPFSLLISPMQWRIVLVYAAFGAVIGVLYLTRLTLLQMLGLATYMLGIEPVTAFALAQGGSVDNAAWVGQCIVTSIWVFNGYGPRLFSVAWTSLYARTHSRKRTID